MENMKYDKLISTDGNKGSPVSYGLVQGSREKAFVIKVGTDGSIRGYEDKYLRMALWIRERFGLTVLVAGNPRGSGYGIRDAFDVLEKNAELSDPYEAYFMGVSKGAVDGAQEAYLFPQIKRLLLVNGPIMINTVRTLEGLLNFSGETCALVYGGRDPSARKVDIIRRFLKPQMECGRVRLFIEEKADHQYVGMLDEFMKLPELILT